MKKFIAYIICAVLILAGYVYSNTLTLEQFEGTDEIMAKGKVLSLEEIFNNSEESDPVFAMREWQVEVLIKSGAFANRTISTTHHYGANPAYDFLISPNDEVILSLDVEGNELKSANISDFSRGKYL